MFKPEGGAFTTAVLTGGLVEHREGTQERFAGGRTPAQSASRAAPPAPSAPPRAHHTVRDWTPASHGPWH